MKQKNGDPDIPEAEDLPETEILKRKIRTLEEELKRKQGQIEKLRQENKILFNTAMKRTEEGLKKEKK
ncbi:MAG: hypothetical protein V1659_00050 [Candidatus Woesearchaeota archaeon]